MPHDDHRDAPEPSSPTYPEIYRQIVVTLSGSGDFAMLRSRLYELLESAKIRYRRVREIPDLRIVAIQVDEGEDVGRVLDDVNRARGLVEVAEQNRPLRPNAVGNDLLVAEQWALARISAEQAWQVVAAASPTPVAVALIDTGISTTHPDLAGHLWTDASGNHGVNLLAGTFDVGDMDGHGTMLAGTVAGFFHNALGISTATWPIRLMTVKFHDVRTPPNALNGVVAIVWAVLNGARVITAAWDVGLPLTFLKSAIQFANLFGVVFVAGAGNDGLDNDTLKTYPASYPVDNIISVMASDEEDDKPGFSNYGETTVHLAAPGVRILSTHSYLIGPQWRRYSGTSAACAYVAHGAALLGALNPKWTPQQIRKRLIETADPSRWLKCVAHGRLNLAHAIGP